MSRSSNPPALRKLRYLDAKSQLEKRIREMPPLAPFPSERDLCTEFGVSRTTIRRTLAEMEKEGVIHRLAGKGTFTADTKYTDHAMQSFIGFDEDATVRRLLDHCGLSFEPACLIFWLNDRSVRTASAEQVRQPIFTGGLDQWRHFEPWLDGLKSALGSES